jgi:uncharacterized oligopeptide transporter (OPT) family protein
MSDQSSSHPTPPDHLPIGEHAEGYLETPQKPPPLPPDASPEDKDRHWFRYVYQGDRMPQLTVRAVVMGGFLGMLMSAANLYTTLSIGWAFGIAITASVLSFVIWNFVRFASGNRVSQMSVLETACMASCASAAGYSTGSTIATMFGALVLLHDTPPGQTVNTWDVTPPWVAVVFTLCTGLMGVFLAIPMKRQQINHEQLPFPSGIAAAETLRSLYSASKDAARKAYILVIGLAAGLLIGFLRVGDDVLDSVRFLRSLFDKISFLRIPEHLDMHWLDRLYPAQRHAAGFAFEPSALLIAAGMIVGMRTSVTLLISSLLLYGVVGPKLAELDAAALEKPAMTLKAAAESVRSSDDFAAVGAAAAQAVIHAAQEMGVDPALIEDQVKGAADAAVAEATEAKASNPEFNTEEASKAIAKAAWTAVAPVVVERVSNAEAYRKQEEARSRAMTEGTPEYAAALERVPMLLDRIQTARKARAGPRPMPRPWRPVPRRRRTRSRWGRRKSPAKPSRSTSSSRA